MASVPIRPIKQDELSRWFGSQILVFEIWRVNEFEHRIAEKIRVSAIVEIAGR